MHLLIINVCDIIKLQLPHITVDWGICCVFLLYVCDYCVFLLPVYYMFLQYFDTVGWVF